VFFNVVIFYLLYAVLTNQVDKWVWVGVGLIVLESIVLALNKMKCPLTNIAGRYTHDRQPNFDIYLPMWLAKYNKHIYGTLFLIALVILGFRELVF